VALRRLLKSWQLHLSDMAAAVTTEVALLDAWEQEAAAEAEEPADEWLTIAETAERLGVGYETIRLKAKRGELPAFGSGRLTRIRVSDLVTNGYKL